MASVCAEASHFPVIGRHSFLAGQCGGVGRMLFVAANTVKRFLILKHLLQVVGLGSWGDLSLVYHASYQNDDSNDQKSSDHCHNDYDWHGAVCSVIR